MSRPRRSGPAGTPSGRRRRFQEQEAEFARGLKELKAAAASRIAELEAAVAASVERRVQAERRAARADAALASRAFVQGELVPLGVWQGFSALAMGFEGAYT